MIFICQIRAELPCPFGNYVLTQIFFILFIFFLTFITFFCHNIFHHKIYYLETFVYTEKFIGTSYKSSNWSYLGKTTGRGKNDQTHKVNRSIKSVYDTH